MVAAILQGAGARHEMGQFLRDRDGWLKGYADLDIENGPSIETIPEPNSYRRIT
jgi:hypothetical protein